MMQKLWGLGNYDNYDYEDFDYTLNDIPHLKNLIGSPPPPYSKEDLLANNEYKSKTQSDKKIVYSNVGQEIYVKVTKKPDEEIGLTILSGEAFKPSWPTVLDIKRHSPSDRAQQIRIGDQIKELCGIPTEELAHSQVLALFSKATDEVLMTIIRGVEPTDRSFDWYKHPFSSVDHTYHEIALAVNSNNSESECDHECDNQKNGSTSTNFTTFKTEYYEKKQKPKSTFAVRHIRSQSCGSKRNFLDRIPRQRRCTVDNTYDRFDRLHKYDLIVSPPASRKTAPKYIADEIKKLSITESMPFNVRYDSQRSLSSTVSSFSNTSTGGVTNDQMTTRNQPGWYDDQPGWHDNVKNIYYNEVDETDIKRCDDSENNSNGDLFKNFVKAPVNILRNSFRKKKIIKDIEKECEREKRFLDTSSNSVENTFTLTMWIADRKRLGLKLSEGSISPYGDSNIYVRDVKKFGTAYKIFQEGDELLEIDGIPINGSDVYTINQMISRLEGQYVEFKIFRPMK